MISANQKTDIVSRETRWYWFRRVFFRIDLDEMSKCDKKPIDTQILLFEGRKFVSNNRENKMFVEPNKASKGVVVL